MTKQMVTRCIEVLKAEESRFILGIAVSCFLDLVLAAFYFTRQLVLVAVYGVFLTLFTIYCS